MRCYLIFRRSPVAVFECVPVSSVSGVVLDDGRMQGNESDGNFDNVAVFFSPYAPGVCPLAIRCFHFLFMRVFHAHIFESSAQIDRRPSTRENGTTATQPENKQAEDDPEDDSDT